MKHIAVILLFFFPLFAISQSKQSDEYYNKGVELYNKEKYKEAIPYFEQSAELDFQEMEEENSRREYSIHWLAACYFRLGNEAKAEDIYPGEYMVPPVDRRLTVESDALSEKANEAYNDGDYQTAIACLKRMIQIEKAAEGENHPWLANDYLLLGCCYPDRFGRGNERGRVRIAARLQESRSADYRNEPLECGRQRHAAAHDRVFQEFGIGTVKARGVPIGTKHS